VIRIVPDDLSGTPCEAILRPASAEWSAVTPAMRRLELAAGPALESQCHALDELPVGSAVITGAGALAARFMIHVIVRSIDEQVSVAGVRRGMQNGLRRIAEWGITSVAMAPLGTGAGNLDADDSASIMIPLLAAAMRAGGPPTEVVVHVDSDYERDVFERHVRAAGPTP
jgi:O-acetyl-ADP-ribose deacetylase (regulator of RNase III)